MTKLMRNPLDRYVKPIGTFFSKFRLGRYGPYIGARGDDVSTFASSGRDDSLDPNVAYAAIRAWALKLFGGGVVFNAGAKGAGSDWSVEVTWPQTGLTENIRIILPSNTPSPGDVLTVVTFIAGTITLEWAPGGGGGGGSSVATIDKDFGNVQAGDERYFELRQGVALNSVTILADQPGDLLLDIWAVPYGSYDMPTTPTAADSITNGTPPTLSGDNKYFDAVLSGWTTALPAGTTLVFKIQSVTDISSVSVILGCVFSASIGGVSSVSSGDLIAVDNTDPFNPIVNVDDSLKTGTIYVEFDTGPTLGGNFSKPMMAPYDGTITQADIYAGVGQTGNAVIDVYKSTYATWPALTSITGASPPTLTGSSKATDTALTGWTTGVSIGDLFVFELASYAGLTQVTCTLSVAKS